MLYIVAESKAWSTERNWDGEQLWADALEQADAVIGRLGQIQVGRMGGEVGD